MKKSSSKILLLFAAISFLLSANLVLADGVCSKMKIVHVGISSGTASGAAVYLQDLSGSGCLAISPGGIAQFYLSTNNTDKALAVMLTAASMKKNVWVYATGSGAPYTITNLQVLNITD
jgi:hypothetical protein